MSTRQKFYFTMGETTYSINIYADGSTMEEISTFNQNVVSGYTFNPTLFRKLEVTDYLGHCKKTIEACGNLPVSLEVIADDTKGMVRQARILNVLSSNVFVKIPITFTSGETTLPVIKTLTEEGVKLNITAVFTKEQVRYILPVLREADSIISIFAGRLYDIGINALEVVRDMADLIHKESNCQVLWASPRMVYDLKNACMANCDIITMLPSLIRKLALFKKTPEEYSLATVKMFYQDAVTSEYEL